MLIPYDGLSIIYIVLVHWILGILKYPPIMISGNAPFLISLSIFISRDCRSSSLLFGCL